MGKVSFCTCNDYDCPFNPVNHNEGCTPCIAKNLKEREIPSCFLMHRIRIERLIGAAINGRILQEW